MIDSFVIFSAPVSSTHTRICLLPFQMQQFDNGAARRCRKRKVAELKKNKPKCRGEQRNYIFVCCSFIPNDPFELSFLDVGSGA
jgi:hypothetical protein